MPFDAAPPLEAAPLAGIALLRDRRVRAVALWRTVPSWRVQMFAWRLGPFACYLGWLAIREHDGWALDALGAPIWGRAGHAFLCGADYFGLDRPAAMHLFGGEPRDCRKADVPGMLLAMPYGHG